MAWVHEPLILLRVIATSSTKAFILYACCIFCCGVCCCCYLCRCCFCCIFCWCIFDCCWCILLVYLLLLLYIFLLLLLYFPFRSVLFLPLCLRRLRCRLKLHYNFLLRLKLKSSFVVHVVQIHVLVHTNVSFVRMYLFSIHLCVRNSARTINAPSALGPCLPFHYIFLYVSLTICWFDSYNVVIVSLPPYRGPLSNPPLPTNPPKFVQ